MSALTPNCIAAVAAAATVQALSNGRPEDHTRRVALWREVAGDKPYISFIHLDLLADPDAPLRRHRFGASVGRNSLIAELQAMRDAGVNHIGLNLRRNQRPLADTMHEIAAHVL